jgi:hypothetical protein
LLVRENGDIGDVMATRKRDALQKRLDDLLDQELPFMLRYFVQSGIIPLSEAETAIVMAIDVTNSNQPLEPLDPDDDDPKEA